MSRSGNGRQQSLVLKYLDTFPRPEGIPEWPELCPPTTREEIAIAAQMGEWAIGDPDDARRSASHPRSARSRADLPVLADGTPLCEIPEFADRPHA
mgnify:CR=1 FL=1